MEKQKKTKNNTYQLVQSVTYQQPVYVPVVSLAQVVFPLHELVFALVTADYKASLHKMILTVVYCGHEEIPECAGTAEEPFPV